MCVVWATQFGSTKVSGVTEKGGKARVRGE